MRYLVGLGAGKQKFEVDLVLRNKKDQNVIAMKTVIDRKIGGLLRGSDEKGQYDFAEKISDFIRSSIDQWIYKVKSEKIRPYQCKLMVIE